MHLPEDLLWKYFRVALKALWVFRANVQPTFLVLYHQDCIC